MATATKERILDTAERLFADHGFTATSLRDITNEAEVNLAAVNYHFGSKEALLLAVLERAWSPINRARLDRLDALEQDTAGASIPTESLVRAFLTPLFEKWCEWGESEPKFLRLVGRMHGEVDPKLRAKFIEPFEQVFLRFSAAFQRSLPKLDATEVHWRVLFLVGSMAYTVTWGTTINLSDSADRRDPVDILENLIQFASTGMTAPVPQPIGVRRAGRAR